jgi:hypothetical protein
MDQAPAATDRASGWIDPAFQYGDQQHVHYLEQGYCIFDRFLTAEGLEAGRQQIQRMLTELQPGRSPEDMISCHHQESWMFELARAPQLLDMIERQIGPDIVLWSSHMLIKPPRTGNAVPWHQDLPYWELDGELAAGVWISFDDLSSETGTMSVLPGWHEKGELRRRESGQDRFNEEIAPDALPVDVEQRKVEYNLRAGQMAIHHTMMPHSSTPNRSDRWRRVLVLRYMSADGAIGEKSYEDYRTGESFARECFLVRGSDVGGFGLRISPFEQG